MPSNPKTVDLGRRPAGYGSLIMLVAVAPLLVSYIPDGKPKNLTSRKTYRVFARYREPNARYMHIISSLTDRIPPTAPSDLTVTNPPRPLVQAVQSYIKPKFLTSHTTDPFDSTGGDLIVVCASSHDGVTLTPSDSFSNKWISAAGPTNTSRGFNPADTGLVCKESNRWFRAHVHTQSFNGTTASDLRARRKGFRYLGPNRRDL